MQTIIGTLSINVGVVPHDHIPDPDDPPGIPSTFRVFGTVIALVLLTGMGVLGMARRWWVEAKRKYARKRV